MTLNELYYLIVLTVMVLIIFGSGVIIVLQDKRIRKLKDKLNMHQLDAIHVKQEAVKERMELTNTINILRKELELHRVYQERKDYSKGVLIINDPLYQEED